MSIWKKLVYVENSYQQSLNETSVLVNERTQSPEQVTRPCKFGEKCVDVGDSNELFISITERYGPTHIYQY